LVFISSAIALVLLAGAMPSLIEESAPTQSTPTSKEQSPTSDTIQPGTALDALQKLEVKGRAPKTGYSRAQFGSGWAVVNGCSTRDVIMYRDLTNVTLADECTVESGVLNDAYTGTVIQYSKANPSAVQIDHVIALSDAWQKGAQLLSEETREQLANDPLELIAVSGKANQIKSDADAATWLPDNKAFRCQYIARQVAVKQKYLLWVTAAERKAMEDILNTCQSESLP
jgi:hypothetical protein